MSGLTDLEICKKIADINGDSVFMMKSALGSNWMIAGKNHGGYKPYNPLVDDALCFMLMVKYDVERVYEPYDCIGWHYKCLLTQEKLILERTYFGKGEETPDISVNKAICLAIIELHK
jgi:hypothetical protein